MTERLGIDVGGSGIKGAPVDLEAGALSAQRLRVPTPKPATPDAVIATVAELVGRFPTPGPIGVTVPAAVQRGIVQTAANIDPSWIEVDALSRLTAQLNRPVVVLNDADAAGIAEMRYGAGRDQPGTVMIVTLGTGIGTAIFVDGRLVPNLEFGHLEVRGREAEARASAAVRTTKSLSLSAWAKRVDEVLRTYERLIWPDLFIIGGGISKRAAEFIPWFTTHTPVVAAQLRNDAGIVGAAVAAQEA
ncbi:MAG: ROK family protein [Chloroflexi bacterium]|nr:ROK family protein [Chloroflexota bacterium]